MPIRRLLLWDIDGTLVVGRGVGAEAIEGAAAFVLGHEVERGGVTMHGKTDTQILTEILRAAALDDDVIAVKLPLAMAEAERLLARAQGEFRRRGSVLDGVVDALDRLAATDGVRQSLVTGNLTANAAVKLAAFDLAAYFDLEVGGYDTDQVVKLLL